MDWQSTITITPENPRGSFPACLANVQLLPKNVVPQDFTRWNEGLGPSENYRDPAAW